MKAKKKRIGTKAQIRATEERERHIATAIFLTFILLIIIISAYFTHTFLNQPQNQTTSPTSPQLKAAILDQLSLTIPNQTFIETATNTLEQAGYTVDYYPGENITVQFYRNLPTHEYRLIILRVHSTATNPDATEGPVTLFTSERYDRTKYVYEQLTDQLVMVAFSQDEMNKGITYFGINPPFLTGSMNSRFQNTIIIMMGCEGLDNTLMAQAFIQKGAKVYISWDKPVSASHTDTAIIHLLQHFLMEKTTLKESVRQTFKEIGFDPIYKSLLIYYPLKAGEQTIEKIDGES
jgi:hypothetical protein